MQRIDTTPRLDNFTPLQDHQEQTPATFFGSKPVLYAHYSDLALSAPAAQFHQHAIFSHFTSEREGDDALARHVDVWVDAENLTLFQTQPSPIGASIPYPTVALHAIMKYRSTVEALYMNLSLNDADAVNDEEDIQLLELTVLPPAHDSDATSACVHDIFNAMNTCADLHPDLDMRDEDAEDVLDESAPGATGWITADNMDEYLDENGNFIGTTMGGAELGPGAGTVRQRDEADGEVNGINGADEHGDKYHRIG